MIYTRPLYCPVCGQRVESDTDGQLPDVHRLPEHTPRDEVNLCMGLVVEVHIKYDTCSRCGGNMVKNTAGVCRKCFGEMNE